MSNKEYVAEASRFVKFREKFQLSQTEIAEILETKQPNISKIEKGDRPLTFHQLRVLRNKFKLNINWYITGQGTMILDQSEKSTVVADITALKKDYDDLFALHDELRKTVKKLVRDFYAKD